MNRCRRLESECVYRFERLSMILKQRRRQQHYYHHHRHHCYLISCWSYCWSIACRIVWRSIRCDCHYRSTHRSFVWRSIQHAQQHERRRCCLRCSRLWWWWRFGRCVESNERRAAPEARWTRGRHSMRHGAHEQAGESRTQRCPLATLATTCDARTATVRSFVVEI